ncbi:MAG: redoxin domain-containing protein [Oceanicaulis sp.]|nr:redoxin domain-containing protein [Oceanicaulis sp.]
MITRIFVRKLACALAVSLSAPVGIAAAADPDPVALSREAAAEFGPAIGARAPDFALPDAHGETRTLADIAGPNGAVIYFNRSLDWCPICLVQTIELQAAAEAFEAAGWGLAVLTYDSPDALARAADRRELTLTLLSDEDSAVIDAFDVRDPIYADPRHRAHGVPYPVAIAIRRNGIVAAKFWHEGGLGAERGFSVRVSTEDVLAALN